MPRARDLGHFEVRRVLPSATRQMVGPFYVDARIPPNGRLPLPAEHEDRGVFVSLGSVSVDGVELAEGTCGILGHRPDASIEAGPHGAWCLILGGDVADGPRYISWNFVTTSTDAIAAARAQWQSEGHGRFDRPRGHREAFIPLP